MTVTAAAPFGALVAELSDWSVAPADLVAASRDRSGSPVLRGAALLVRARSVTEVQATLRFATAHGLPVVTRGAGSGVAGGAIAGPDAIVLDLSRLDRILAIRPDDQVAVVEPGVITADLDAAAAAHGLFYAPDPGSVAISTIGGNIATNAGGLRGAKYGVTRDAVLALDVVRADGRLLSLGAPVLKRVTGYDLLGLFVGSEGTLGVIVGATLRLLPRPVATSTVAAFFDDVRQAADAAIAVRSSGVRPVTLELVDGATLEAIDALEGTSLRASGAAFLLVQTDGHAAAIEAAVVADVLEPLARVVERSDDPARSAELTTARRQALPALERLGRVLIEDIAVPPSRLAEAIDGIHRIAERTGARIFVFAHAGDGNVHPIVVVDRDADDVPEHVAEAVEAVFALALRLGGTVTGEHGIGLLKRDWVAREVGEDVDRIQHQIKSLLDPGGILNPGKAI
ncbi:FAD-linked oxidase C-terminal domain-containing protein [Patulibacter sp. NPDC049589]|uniref:FAD-binding oxidoreductase n=1 Tax=Patulibacter sp. NPDC049589 TaxID=3154731 RepID=UPI00344A6D9C